ncbi:MAG: PAS domain-containing protein [Burkholderiales bacterium]
MTLDAKKSAARPRTARHNTHSPEPVDPNRAERVEQLESSDTRFQSLLNLTADLYWEQDEKFRFTFLSEAAQGTLRAPPLAYLGKTHWEVHPDGADDEQWARHRALLEAHRPFRGVEMMFNTAEAAACHLSVSGDPVFDAEGRFRGYRGVETDITRRK